MIAKYLFIAAASLILLLSFCFERSRQTTTLLKASLENVQNTVKFSDERKEFLFASLEDLEI